MWAVWWDFLSCCTTRDRDADHLLPAVPPARAKRSDSGRGEQGLGLPSTPTAPPSTSTFWGLGAPAAPAATPSTSSFWGLGEKKFEQKAEPGNHVGLKEVSSTHSQIHMLKEQVKLLQRQNDTLMVQNLAPQVTLNDTEDYSVLKTQIAELKNRNAQLEDELSSQGSSRGTTFRRTPRAQRGLKQSVTPRKRSSGVPTVNLAAAAAQVARRGLLKKKSDAEDGKKWVDLTSVRPAGPRPPMRVRKSTMELDGDEGNTETEGDICDLTGLRDRQSLFGSP